jgi:hypothetical protein
VADHEFQEAGARRSYSSTSFIAEAYWDGKGLSPAIRFSYEKDGVEYQSGIEFRCVLAMRKRAERCCTGWHIEGAYDILVEVESSPWVQEMRADTKRQWRDKWETHHYMIYFDGVGCFEAIAESWAALPEHAVPFGAH